MPFDHRLLAAARAELEKAASVAVADLKRTGRFAALGAGLGGLAGGIRSAANTEGSSYDKAKAGLRGAGRGALAGAAVGGMGGALTGIAPTGAVTAALRHRANLHAARLRGQARAATYRYARALDRGDYSPALGARVVGTNVMARDAQDAVEKVKPGVRRGAAYLAGGAIAAAPAAGALVGPRYDRDTDRDYR